MICCVRIQVRESAAARKRAVLSIGLLLGLGFFFRAPMVKADLGPTPPRPQLVLQTGHARSVDAVVISPDGKWVATAGSDNTVRVWDKETGRELRAFIGHSGPVKALACSPDGRWLASAGNDKTVRIWDLFSGAEAKHIPVDEALVQALAFSPGGADLAFGGSGNAVTVVHTASSEIAWKFAGHTGAVTAIAFSGDGKYLASGSADSNVRLWDLAKGKPFKELSGHTDKVEALRFSPDSQTLASGGADKLIKIWKSNGRSVFESKDNKGKVQAIRFLPGGLILFSDSTGSIKTLDVTARKFTNVAAARVGPDFAEDSVASEDLSADGRTLAIASGNRTAALFATDSGERSGTLESRISGFFGVAFSPENRWLAMASNDNSVKLWDLKTGEQVASLSGHSAYVTSLAFGADERRLYSASNDGTIRVWEMSTARPLDVLKGHKSYVTSIAGGRTGRFIISGSSDKTVGIWQLGPAAAPAKFLPGHTGEVTAVALDKEEKTAASGSTDGTVRLWDTESGKETRILGRDLGEVRSVAFSPNGDLLAAGLADGTVRTWNTSTGEPGRTFPGHSGRVTSVVFGTDGGTLFAAGEDRSIRTFKLSDGEQSVFPATHSEWITSLAAAAGGKWLASASEDGSVVLWDVAAAKPKLTLVSARGGTEWLAVAPDGFFDGSPTTWSQILWRFGGELFSVSPVEIFFNEFYQPGLLAKLLVGSKMPANDITKKDRRQPQVTLSVADPTKGGGPLGERTIKVRVTVAQAPPDSVFPVGGGAKDIRLFRNGALVYYRPGDAIGSAGSAELDVTVPIVAGPNVLSAYAFNNDDVKSVDATITVTGADTLRRKGRTRIVSVGVGRYANPDFNLKFVAGDAANFGDLLRAKQLELGQSDAVDVVTLRDQEATKENILRSLESMSSDGTDPAQPEDTVVVYFSGHGISEGDRFYMIPFDIGYMGRRADLAGSADGYATIMAHGISDQDLERAFRSIDAGNVMLIIDACESGTALRARDERLGPMNSKGLVQFAYEKGMFVLTATEGAEAAYVSNPFKRSYLNYALIDEALRLDVADNNPADGTLVLREWFDYAARRVPALQEEAVKKREEQAANQAKGLTERDTQKAASVSLPEQRPRAFYRRQAERQPVVIARVSKGTAIK